MVHVKEGDNLYGEEFTRENRVVGVLWANKRDSGLWFASPTACELDIASTGKGESVGDGWKGFVYALEAIYDSESALKKIRNLSGHDNGNSLTNLLWWVYSRGD
ncbi:uncharacterized protein LOC108472253 [Gossypium arboreum]|uniref:uncharacterized protein LOC108472253 n=1 Tax=Gossypium arboreum TaxID=29729 RepID=UPI00081955E9|nr:uncharacterized protein LOC108472253 [Gossypium arboreum]